MLWSSWADQKQACDNFSSKLVKATLVLYVVVLALEDEVIR